MDTWEFATTAVIACIILYLHHCSYLIPKTFLTSTPDGSIAPAVGLCVHVRLTSQHRVLVLCCADQPADTINHLALRVQLFLLGFLAEKNHWEIKQGVRGVSEHIFFKFCFLLYTKGSSIDFSVSRCQRVLLK